MAIHNIIIQKSLLAVVPRVFFVGCILLETLVVATYGTAKPIIKLYSYNGVEAASKSTPMLCKWS